MTESDSEEREMIEDEVLDVFRMYFSNGPRMLSLNPEEPVMYFLTEDIKSRQTSLYVADLRSSVADAYRGKPPHYKIEWSQFLNSTNSTRKLTKEEVLLHERMVCLPSLLSLVIVLCLNHCCLS